MAFFSFLNENITRYWPCHAKSCLWEYAYSEGPDQPHMQPRCNFAHAQDDLNLHIFKGTFSLDMALIFSVSMIPDNFFFFFFCSQKSYQNSSHFSTKSSQHMSS